MYAHDPLKKAVCEVGKRMYEKSLVIGNDGNISWRISDTEVLLTPTGVCKGDLTPDMILKIDLDGNVLEGRGKPSGEVNMHLGVYKAAPQRKAVVHAHPPYAAAFAVANIPLDKLIYPTCYTFFGAVPVTPYATATTTELAEAVMEQVRTGKKGILLANHGALSCAATLWDAYYLMERLESYAQICFLAQLLGGGRVLTPSEQEALNQKIARQLNSGAIYE
jgi:L-fuculose-phosphate aldolase